METFTFFKERSGCTWIKPAYLRYHISQKKELKPRISVGGGDSFKFHIVLHISKFHAKSKGCNSGFHGVVLNLSTSSTSFFDLFNKYNV